MSKNLLNTSKDFNPKMLLITRKLFKRFLLLIIGAFILYLQLQYGIFQVLWNSIL